MQMVAPAGPMYQAGTLAGNPLAMSAGLATLELINEEAVWEQMEARGRQLDAGIESAAKKAGIPIRPRMARFSSEASRPASTPWRPSAKEAIAQPWPHTSVWKCFRMSPGCPSASPPLRR